MEDSKARDLSQCVRVALNIRPLNSSELVAGSKNCITMVAGEPQVQIGEHAFTFDYVYGSTSTSCTKIYDDCVAPLVDALFDGYNATVLAYGQTGSGKTYMMGTNYNGEGSDFGIIPKVIESIFKRVEETKSTNFLMRVSFVEIFKEKVFDLLDSKPKRAPLQIRETINGDITLVGVTKVEVGTKEEMVSYISHGSLTRAIGVTNMNNQSSRSHAILTISMEQKKIGDDILGAKLHLVDLAGSERTKRSGTDGMRLKEGTHINKGLLALGNVISALGDEKKRKKGDYVPYRDSKLTRLLQDSLGGNSKTLMIACVSPADTNVEETLNTLKYANRARNIQNKAVINRDPMVGQIQGTQSQIEQLQVLELNKKEAELLVYREKSDVLQAQVLQKEAELLICRQRVDVLETQVLALNKKEAELLFYREKSEVLETQVSMLNKKEAELLFYREKSDILQAQVSEKEAELLICRQKLGVLEAQVIELNKKEAEHLFYREKLDVLQAQVAEKDAELLINRQKLDVLEAQVIELNKKEVEVLFYREKLDVLEAQVLELNKRQGAQSQLLGQEQRNDEGLTLEKLSMELEDSDKSDQGHKYDSDTSESKCSSRGDDEWVMSEEQRGKKSSKSGLHCTCTRMSSCRTFKCECRSAGAFCRTSCRCSYAQCSNRKKRVVKSNEPKPNQRKKRRKSIG